VPESPPLPLLDPELAPELAPELPPFEPELPPLEPLEVKFDPELDDEPPPLELPAWPLDEPPLEPDPAPELLPSPRPPLLPKPPEEGEALHPPNARAQAAATTWSPVANLTFGFRVMAFASANGGLRGGGNTTECRQSALLPFFTRPQSTAQLRMQNKFVLDRH
jgi:hypothetical protein